MESVGRIHRFIEIYKKGSFVLWTDSETVRYKRVVFFGALNDEVDMYQDLLPYINDRWRMHKNYAFCDIIKAPIKDIKKLICNDIDNFIRRFENDTKNEK